MSAEGGAEYTPPERSVYNTVMYCILPPLGGVVSGPWASFPTCDGRPLSRRDLGFCFCFCFLSIPLALLSLRRRAPARCRRGI